MRSHTVCEFEGWDTIIILPMYYCVKCGKENGDDAVYCQRCGSLLEPEDETRVASRGSHQHRTADSNEVAIFSISPTLIFVKVGYGVAVAAAVVLVALVSTFVPAVSPWIVVTFGLILLLVPAYYHFKQKLTRYTLTGSKIEIDSGLISRTTRNIPLGRIQDVTVSTTMSQRLLGFGDIVIDNASEEGGKLILKNVNSPKQHAGMLLRQMRRH